MSSTASPSATILPSAAPGPAFVRWAPTFLAIGFFWLIILNQQRLEWSVNPVYSYGWAVPFLAGYLFWSRWQTRPAPRAPLGLRWFITGAALLLLAYLPVRVIQEANPDWVKINWIMAGLWGGLALLTLARVGGGAYAGYFFFPLLFCFTALPWPVWIEDTLEQHLMKLNASLSAEVLTLFGTPALAQGNLVQVADHWVNVEEACSGIRSLQTAFMMALFLGEFYRMNRLRRGVLLASSFAVAFLINLVRTITLTDLAKTGGVEKWHDTVGTIAMIACLAVLWLLAEALRRRGGAEPAASPRALPRVAPFSWAGAAAVCGALLFAEAATFEWYHLHERALPPPEAWTLQWPKQAPDFVEGNFSERMWSLLKFNTGTTASWRTASGDAWQMYYLQWAPGRVSKFLSSSHYPTVCLPATGLKLVSETGVWNCPVGDTEIPFTTYLFDENGEDVYVYHAVIEDRPTQSGPRLSYRQVSSSERLASVWRGERNLGQRVVGIAVRGPVSPSEARSVVAETLGTVLQIGPAAARQVAVQSR